MILLLQCVFKQRHTEDDYWAGLLCRNIMQATNVVLNLLVATFIKQKRLTSNMLSQMRVVSLDWPHAQCPGASWDW